MWHKKIILIVLFISSLVSCNNPDKIPQGVLSEKEMQSLLIDIHTLEGGWLVMPNAVSYKEGYATVFKKHNITAIQYEQSMAFYQKKPHLLEKVYSAVRDTFEKRMNR